MNFILGVADKKKNSLLAAVDLCPSYKVFVSWCRGSVDRNGTDSDEAFAQRIIELSKAQEDYWIPVVILGGNIYAAAGIKEVSDGKQIMFTGGKHDQG